MSVMRIILRLPGQPGGQGKPRTVVCDVTACAGPAGLLTLAPRELITLAPGETFALELNTADVRLCRSVRDDGRLGRLPLSRQDAHPAAPGRPGKLKLQVNLGKQTLHPPGASKQDSQSGSDQQ